MDHLEFEPARAAFMEIYATCLSRQTTWWPGMDQVVDHLEASGIVWGIVTNKIARFTEPLLRDINLYDRCAIVVSGDTTPHPKPHPAPVAHAIDRLGLPPRPWSMWATICAISNLDLRPAPDHRV